MKKQFVVAVAWVAWVAFALATPYASNVVAQDFPEGPAGEINSPGVEGDFTGGDFFDAGVAGAGLGHSDFLRSPNVAYSPTGEAIEIFDPLVPFGQPPTRLPELLGSPVAASDTKTDWITADGRINLENDSAESQLWAPDDATVAGWSDGPMGLQLGVDWLFFSRATTGGLTSFNLVTSDFSTSDDIELDVESTPRYRIGVGSEYGTGYEFVAYDFDEFSGGLTLMQENVVPVFFGGIPDQPVDSYSVTYQSRIKSYELNVWARRSEAVRVGYGLRHFAIEEKYDVTQGADTNTANTGATGTGTGGFTGFFSRTDNNLFGGQLMLELYRRVTPSTYLVGGVKGMLLHNRSDVDADTANHDGSGEDSFVTGGVNFNGGITCRPFRGLRFRAGYEGNFIGSVASGPAQSDGNSLFDPTISPVGDSIYFGGGYVGCTVTF